MDTPEQGLQCHWAGCTEEFKDEVDWIKHVAIHVFTLKPGERTPWLGPPELDPDLQHVTTTHDDQSDREDDDDDDGDRAFSEINAMSSPASTPPQAELPNSPDLAEKINGPSASAFATAGPSHLISPVVPERTLSHRTSASVDDVEAGLVPTSPSPSINAPRDPNSNQETSQVLPPPQPLPTSPQSLLPSISAARFRRGIFQMESPSQRSLRFGRWTDGSQSQSQPPASQTLQSSNDSQMNGNGLSWLNTQAFHPPEVQGSYESD